MNSMYLSTSENLMFMAMLVAVMGLFLFCIANIINKKEGAVTGIICLAGVLGLVITSIVSNQTAISKSSNNFLIVPHDSNTEYYVVKTSDNDTIKYVDFTLSDMDEVIYKKDFAGKCKGISLSLSEDTAGELGVFVKQGEK